MFLTVIINSLNQAIQPRVVGPLFIYFGGRPLFSKFFGIGFGTSIDMVREAGAIARPCCWLMISLARPYMLSHYVS